MVSEEVCIEESFKACTGMLVSLNSSHPSLSDLPKAGVKQRSSLKVSRGMLVDLLTHVCGRLPPGIPLNPHPCSTPSEKVNQEYSTFATVLAFIK